jgi:hypothetical protein
MTDERKEAAARLDEHLFGPRYDLGMLGIGSDRYHAYMFDEENRWLGNKPDEWAGWPVEYHWGVGRPVARGAT